MQEDSSNGGRLCANKRQEKIYGKFVKKRLTNDGRGGNIAKLSDERPSRGREESGKRKKPDKKRKNLLTNWGKRDILERL